MKTDSLFYQLFKQLPETLFQLLGLSSESARAYRFDSVELKKSLRIDGLFKPNKRSLPLYFVEVQYQRVATFYANLLAKVYSYLGENDPAQDWRGVAIFPSRSIEPLDLNPYSELLESKRIVRVYLDEYAMPEDPPFGLGILQMLTAPEWQVKELSGRLVKKAKERCEDAFLSQKVIELAEEVLVRRFTHLSREEVLKMFELADIRTTRIWKEAHEEGKEEGREEAKAEREALKRKMVHNCLAKGMAQKAIAELMEVSLSEVRRLAKDAPR